MKDFKKRGGFKKSYGNHFGDDRGERGPKELYQATCSDCGKSCEVPFRPSGGRPVFCRDCFAKNPPAPRDAREGGFKKPFGRFDDRGGDRPPFKPRETFAPRPHAVVDNTAVTKQLEMVNAKLDRLIAVMEESAKKPAPKAAKKAAVKKK